MEQREKSRVIPGAKKQTGEDKASATSRAAYVAARNERYKKLVESGVVKQPVMGGKNLRRLGATGQMAMFGEVITAKKPVARESPVALQWMLTTFVNNLGGRLLPLLKWDCETLASLMECVAECGIDLMVTSHHDSPYLFVHRVHNGACLWVQMNPARSWVFSLMLVDVEFAIHVLDDGDYNLAATPDSFTFNLAAQKLGGDGGCVGRALAELGLQVHGLPEFVRKKDLCQLAACTGMNVRCEHHGIKLAEVRQDPGLERGTLVLRTDQYLSHCHGAEVHKAPLNLAHINFVEVGDSMCISTCGDQCDHCAISSLLHVRDVSAVVLDAKPQVTVDFTRGANSAELVLTPDCMIGGRWPGLCSLFSWLRSCAQSDKGDDVVHVNARFAGHHCDFSVGADDAVPASAGCCISPGAPSVFAIGSSKAEKRRAAKGRLNQRIEEGLMAKTPAPLGSYRDAATEAVNRMRAAVKGDKANVALERRLHDLERKLAAKEAGPFAANFGHAGNLGMAATFGLDTNPSYIGLDGEPYQFADQLIEDVVIGGKMHPPRFGFDTAVMRVNASKTMTLSGLSTGYDVVIVTPLQAAHKGTIILQRSGTDWSVLGYASPDLELEDICEKTCVLLASLKVGSVQLAGGTTVVASNAIVESGVSCVCPLAIQTGKMNAVAGMNNATRPGPIGKSGAEITELTCDLPDQAVTKYNLADPLEMSLMLSSSSAANIAGIGRMFAPVSGTCVYGSNGTGSPDYINSGFSQVIVPGTGNLICATGTSATLWNFKNHQDFLRHLWYGRGRLNYKLCCSSDTGTAPRVEVRATVTYSDGSSLYFDDVHRPGVVTTTSGFTLSGEFRWGLDSATDAKSGLLVTDVALRLTFYGSAGSSVYYYPSAAAAINNLAVTEMYWDDVHPDTKYVSHIISGLVSAHTLTIDTRVEAEVFVKKGSKNANFVQIQRVLPYNPHELMVAYRRLRTAGPATGEASAFTRFLKKGWRTVRSVALQPFWAGAKEGLRNVATRAGQAIEDASKAVPQAASFGDGEALTVDKMAFPVYFEDGHAEVRYVTKGDGKCPDFVACITDIPLCASGSNYEGVSDGLAFLLAALKAEGWAVRTGCFSGEVRQVAYTPNEVSFELWPIDHGDSKAAGVSVPHEFIFTPDGVMKADGSGIRKMTRGDLVTSSCGFAFERQLTEAPWRQFLRVKLWRSE